MEQNRKYFAVKNTHIPVFVPVIRLSLRGILPVNENSIFFLIIPSARELSIFIHSPFPHTQPKIIQNIFVTKSHVTNNEYLSQSLKGSIDWIRNKKV